MTSWVILQLALLVLTGLLVVLAAATSLQRYARSRSMDKRLAREAAIRPRMMRLLSDDEPDLSPLDELEKAELKVVEELAWSMLSKVRGSSRVALVSWLETRGAVEHARLQTRSHSIVRRATAAEQLGNAGVASTSPDVIRLLDDGNAEVRIVAARALGKLGDPRSVPALLDTLAGSNGLPTSIISMALLHVGPSAIEGLIAGLASRSNSVRGVSAELLGMHGATKASRWLMLMVEHDPDLNVRVNAASALGRIGSPAAIEVLSRATAPEMPQALRIEATRSLGLIGGRTAIVTLPNLLDSEDEELGRVAAASLAASGNAGIEVLELAASGHGLGQERAQDWISRIELDTLSRRHRRHDDVQVISS